MLYRSDLLPLKDFRFSSGIRSFCANNILPLIASPNNPATVPNNASQQPTSSSSQPSTPVEVSEENITTLMGMGFDRESVIRALRVSGNDANRAAAVLLG